MVACLGPDSAGNPALQAQVEQLHDLMLQSRKERERDREIMEALHSAVVGREGKDGAAFGPRATEPGRERVLEEAP